MTAPGDVRPEGGIRQLLQPPADRMRCDHMLVEPKLASGFDHASKLGERLLLIGDRAQDERGDAGVERRGSGSTATTSVTVSG